MGGIRSFQFWLTCLLGWLCGQDKLLVLTKTNKKSEECVNVRKGEKPGFLKDCERVESMERGENRMLHRNAYMMTRALRRRGSGREYREEKDPSGRQGDLYLDCWAERSVTESGGREKCVSADFETSTSEHTSVCPCLNQIACMINQAHLPDTSCNFCAFPHRSSSYSISPAHPCDHSHMRKQYSQPRDFLLPRARSNLRPLDLTNGFLFLCGP